MQAVTVMQVARSASRFSTWNAVRRATLFTAPGAMMSDVSHSRATVRPCAAELELERLHTLPVAFEPPSQSVGAAGKPI